MQVLLLTSGVPEFHPTLLQYFFPPGQRNQEPDSDLTYTGFTPV